jgi:hypothetical protein
VTRHPFDPVALVFGLAFAAAGIIVMTGGELIDEGRVLVPLGLVALGVGLLFRPARPAPMQPARTVPFEYTETADLGTSVAPPPTWPTTQTQATPTEPDRPGPTDAPTADVPAPAAAPEATKASEGEADERLEQPAVEDGGLDGPGEAGPGTPGAEFYLGRDWRAPDDAPADEPDDDAPGR